MTPTSDPFLALAAHRLRLAAAAALVALVLFGLLLALGPDADADAMARTIHPCLNGDEPCNTPPPSPSPR